MVKYNIFIFSRSFRVKVMTLHLPYKDKPKDRQNRPNQTLRNFKIQIRSWKQWKAFCKIIDSFYNFKRFHKWNMDIEQKPPKTTLRRSYIFEDLSKEKWTSHWTEMDRTQVVLIRRLIMREYELPCNPAKLSC